MASTYFRGFTKSVIKLAEYNVTASDINFDLWLILGYRFSKLLAFNFNDLMNKCDVFGVGDSILFILQRNRITFVQDRDKSGSLLIIIPINDRMSHQS